MDVSTDGKRLVFATLRSNLGLAELGIQDRPGDPSIKALASDSARNEYGPAYSPDGTPIAFFTNLKGAENESIGVADANGGSDVQLVRDNRINVFPHWTPDGNRLVYYSSEKEGAGAEFRSVAISGGAPETILQAGQSTSDFYDVGRDGRLLYQKTDGQVQASSTCALRIM